MRYPAGIIVFLTSKNNELRYIFASNHFAALKNT
ncbi:hypothetical protein CfE428DRAFT_4856 [Chthoniobacter flavus Ellin428]|uniref:Uncharacterized protein n=1 Tax=Chthoniobacter flavus Ellin428 TaxID=497964 RepID=B4D7E1_9BACT|nr:hypothetical protein CfE428DRAFT_4856 [Chthoniobacter flavus Ellin428]TCO92410.1 hypothetical protein EV701_106179 [Chthoniobacter flavus]